MSQSTQWDSIQLKKLELPYNRSEAELSDTPRIFRGLNAFVTYGGKLGKRPGTLELDSTGTGINLRVDRLWEYQTIESTVKTIMLASIYNHTTGKWIMKYNIARAGGIYGGTGWQDFYNLRNINESTRPHEVIIHKGLAYVKGFPGSGGDTYGTVILDGSGTITNTSFKYWGIEMPQNEYVYISMQLAKLGTACNSSTTSLTVENYTSIEAETLPVTIQLDYEQMSLTAVSSGTWTVTRGVNGTTAAAHDADTIIVCRLKNLVGTVPWSTTDHKIDVNYFWKYTYAFKSNTGQISNRAKMQTNPDVKGSSTGPFFDLIPEISIPSNYGNADKLNRIPDLVLYRTTDGGGKFYYLDTYPDGWTGTGAYTYEDKYFESGISGGTYNDPVPDEFLDVNRPSPSLTSNTPPPRTIANFFDESVSVTTPSSSTPIASFAGRLWYGIENVLFYSGNEEVIEGVPEECWPSGTLNGNYWRFQYQITNVAATSEALYIFTTGSVYQLTGTSRETFSVRPIFTELGHPLGHSRAVHRFGDRIAFLTHDYRIAIIDNDQYEVISQPLGSDIVDAISNGGEIEIVYWADLDKEYLVVCSHNREDVEQSRQWVYDLIRSKRPSNFQETKHFWFPPWDIRATSVVVAQGFTQSAQKRLIFNVYNDQNTTIGWNYLCYLDPSEQTGTDWELTDSTVTNTAFSFYVDTNLFQVPAGNHINILRQPQATPVVYGILFDRTLYPGDIDPEVYYYKDDFWTDPIAADYDELPQRREVSKAYKTHYLPIRETCQHFGIRIQKTQTRDLFQMQNLTIVFEPDSGS